MKLSDEIAELEELQESHLDSLCRLMEKEPNWIDEAVRHRGLLTMAQIKDRIADVQYQLSRFQGLVDHHREEQELIEKLKVREVLRPTQMYFGKVCQKHPELEGKRYSSTSKCVNCSKEKKRVYNARRWRPEQQEAN